jgi:galactose mutarotase-like enzyme
MKNIKSNKVILKEEDKKVLEFDFTGFPYLAVWSKKDASFVCIEPWFNTADNVNSNGIFEEKEDLIELNSNKSFKANFSVKFF